MYKKLEKYITEVESLMGDIPSQRKEKLREVADYIASKLVTSETAKLTFICTHNSRRSHLGQIWTSVAAAHNDFDGIETYSGGTEATAFHPSAVAALERCGFRIENPGGDNPKYKIRFEDDSEPMVCFSKTFDDPFNPKSGFAAIVACSDANENCPFVPGAELRKPITYRDPKESDGTKQESATYDKRCKQIASEMFYMMSLIKN